MGYETRIYVCDAPIRALEFKEVEKDMTKPYSDGSGYEDKKDKQGNPIYTGRTEKHVIPVAEIDMCKICCDDNDLGKLIMATPDKTYEKEKSFYAFYKGDTLVHTDCYGVLMKDFPIAVVYKAAIKSYKQTY